MRALCLALSILGASTAGAQDSATVRRSPSLLSESVSVGGDSAVLSVGNRTVFVFRAGVGSLKAADRAEMAMDRIKRAQRPGDDSIRVIRDTLGAIILVNNTPVFVVTADDLLPADSLVPEVAALGVIASLREGLGAAEEALNLKALAIGAVSVVAATRPAHLPAAPAGSGADLVARVVGAQAAPPQGPRGGAALAEGAAPGDPCHS